MIFGLQGDSGIEVRCISFELANTFNSLVIHTQYGNCNLGLISHNYLVARLLQANTGI